MSDPSVSSEPVSSLEDLAQFFRASCRPPERWLIGVEQEKLAVYADGTPIRYDGPDGVTALLAALGPDGFEPIVDGDKVIGANRGAEGITLEPGLQVEMSGPPLLTAASCQDIMCRHTEKLVRTGAPLGIRFIVGGFRPFGTLDDVPWLPKKRYDFMRAYLPARGGKSDEMMKRTATVQVNLDYSDEENAMAKLRAAFGVTSLVTALYAASPIVEGRPSRWKSYRAAVWLAVDEDRCGLRPPEVFEPGFGFVDYARWAADVPMFFISRDGVYHPAGGMTFRRFMEQGFDGRPATMADFVLHLSTLFPEVRLKRTLELRGADAGPIAFSEALAALWRGILDDADAREAAFGLVGKASMAEREALRRELPRAGLGAHLGRQPIAPLVRELCEIARQGLMRLPGGAADVGLIDPLLAYAAAGRSPADDMLADFEACDGDPVRLVKRWDLGRQLACRAEAA